MLGPVSGGRSLGRIGTVAAVLTVVGIWPLLFLPEIDVPSERTHSFDDLSLVDPGVGRRASASLRVVDGKIAAGENSQALGSREFSGSFVLPGLIDLHVHHPPRFAIGSRGVFGLLFLAHGVTSVRDTGSLFGDALTLADEWRRGKYAGPRVFSCGPLITGFVPAPTGMRGVTQPEEAEDLIAELKADGVDCIKLHNALSRPAVTALLEAARKHDLPVVAHVGASSSLRAMAGVEVQHLMKVSPSWSRVRHDAVARYVETSKNEGITHTPTLVVFDAVARRAAGKPHSPGAGFLPGYMRDVLWNTKHNPGVAALDAAGGRKPEDRVRMMKEVAGRLHDAGVPLQVGTDTPNPGVVPGESAQQELTLLVAAGLPIEAAWQAATRSAGQRLGVEKLGTLEVGAPADLLFFREDPTVDLAALSSLRAVMVDGRLYRMSQLTQTLEESREVFEGLIFDSLSQVLARAAVSALAPPQAEVRSGP